MKNYIIAFFAVLALSCWMNGNDIPPQKFFSGIKDVLTPGTPTSLQKHDGVYPELQYADGYRNVRVLTDIGRKPNDNPDAGQVEFPYAANN